MHPPHAAVRDVLLSAVMPCCQRFQVALLATELRSIPHVEFIRIGSRIPIFRNASPPSCVSLWNLSALH